MLGYCLRTVQNLKQIIIYSGEYAKSQTRDLKEQILTINFSPTQFMYGQFIPYDGNIVVGTCP